MSEDTQFVVITKEDFNSIVEDAVLARLELQKNSMLQNSILHSEQRGEEELLTRNDAAAMIHVHPNTLLRWEKANFLAPVRIGRRVLYRKGDVYDAMQKGGSVA